MTALQHTQHSHIQKKAGTVPARAIYFGVYNEAKKQYGLIFDKDSTWRYLTAAMTAGLCTQVSLSPVWVIKTRMQLQTPQDMRYRNSLDCFQKMVRQEGWKSLFRGLSASIYGISESSLQFVLYEHLKHRISKETEGLPRELAVWEYMGASMLAKGLAVLVTYPHEVIRTRMREAPLPGEPIKYTKFWSSLRTVYLEEGRAGLYGGMGAHLVRVVPNACILFVTYEVFVRHFAMNRD